MHDSRNDVCWVLGGQRMSKKYCGRAISLLANLGFSLITETGRTKSELLPITKDLLLAVHVIKPRSYQCYYPSFLIFQLIQPFIWNYFLILTRVLHNDWYYDIIRSYLPNFCNKKSLSSAIDSFFILLLSFSFYVVSDIILRFNWTNTRNLLSLSFLLCILTYLLKKI